MTTGPTSGDILQSGIHLQKTHVDGRLALRIAAGKYRQRKTEPQLENERSKRARNKGDTRCRRMYIYIYIYVCVCVCVCVCVYGKLLWTHKFLEHKCLEEGDTLSLSLCLSLTLSLSLALSLSRSLVFPEFRATVCRTGVVREIQLHAIVSRIHVVAVLKFLSSVVPFRGV